MPVLTDTTGRPKGVALCGAMFVGTDGERIYRAFKELVEDPSAHAKTSKACGIYGDGEACKRIADIFE